MAKLDFDEIAENFAFLDEWEDRYRYVIELGKDMPPLPEKLRVSATKVDGCASQVWIVPQIVGQGPDAIIRFQGDSDAMIVKGLIAVLMALYDDKKAIEIKEVDVKSEMSRLGLDEHLSAQRSNGLRAMIARIQGIAHQTSEAA